MSAFLSFCIVHPAFPATIGIALAIFALALLAASEYSAPRPIRRQLRRRSYRR